MLIHWVQTSKSLTRPFRKDLGVRGFDEDVLPTLRTPKASRSAHFLPSIILFHDSEHPPKQSDDIVTLVIEFS